MNIPKYVYKTITAVYSLDNDRWCYKVFGRKYYKASLGEFKRHIDSLGEGVEVSREIRFERYKAFYLQGNCHTDYYGRPNKGEFVECLVTSENVHGEAYIKIGEEKKKVIMSDLYAYDDDNKGVIDSINNAYTEITDKQKILYERIDILRLESKDLGKGFDDICKMLKKAKSNITKHEDMAREMLRVSGSNKNS